MKAEIINPKFVDLMDTAVYSLTTTLFTMETVITVREIAIMTELKACLR